MSIKHRAKMAPKINLLSMIESPSCLCIRVEPRMISCEPFKWYHICKFFQVFLINMDYSMQLQAMLTKESEQAQLQIEDLSKPKTVWQKLRTIFGDW